MFSKAFQRGEGGVEIFSPTGTDPLRSLELKNKSAISKVYDRYIKGNCLVLDQTSVSSSISCPSSSSKTLGIVQPWFCLQLNIPKGKSFSLELIVSETAGQHHRVHFSTSFRGWDANELHARIAWPKEYDNLWVTYVINLEELCRVCFRSTFASLDHFTVYSTCQIRKIFSLSARMTDIVIPAAFDFPIGVSAEICLVGLPAKIEKGAHGVASKPPHASTGRPRGKQTAGAAQTAPAEVGVLGVKKQLTVPSAAANAVGTIDEVKSVERRGPKMSTRGPATKKTLRNADEKERTPRLAEMVQFDDDEDEHDDRYDPDCRLAVADSKRSPDDATWGSTHRGDDHGRESHDQKVVQTIPSHQDLSNPWGDSEFAAKESFNDELGRCEPGADRQDTATSSPNSAPHRPPFSEQKHRPLSARGVIETEAKATPRQQLSDSKDLRDVDDAKEWDLVQQLLRTQERNPWQTSIPSSPLAAVPPRSRSTATTPTRSATRPIVVDGGGDGDPSATPSRRSMKSLNGDSSPSNQRLVAFDDDLRPQSRPVPVSQSVLIAQEGDQDTLASSADEIHISHDVRSSMRKAELEPSQEPLFTSEVKSGLVDDDELRREAADSRWSDDYVYPSSTRALQSSSIAEGPHERGIRLVQASQSVENFLVLRRQAPNGAPSIDQEPVDQYVFTSIQRWEEKITELLADDYVDNRRPSSANAAAREVHELCDTLKRLECDFWRSFGRHEYEQGVGYFEFD